MKQSWRLVGIVAFWLSWPLLFWYLKGTHRTRLLLVCGEEILVVRNWLAAGKWSLPGGGSRRGEDARAAAVRELEEETGISLEARGLHSLGTYSSSDQGFRFTFEVFHVSLPDKPKVRLQWPEVADAAWLAMGRVSKETCGEDVLKALAALSGK